jgi:hypothetical protein
MLHDDWVMGALRWLESAGRGLSALAVRLRRRYSRLWR